MTFLGVLLLATVSRAAETAPVLSNELLDIWNQSYTSQNTAPIADDFNLEAYRPEATESAPGMTSYSRPNGGNSLTPNFDRLISRYGAQRETAPLEMQVQPLSQPRTSFGPTTWKGGQGNTVAGNDKKKDDDDQGGNLENNHHNNGNNGNNGNHNNNGGGGGGNGTPTTPTPEPCTLLLMSAAAGVAGLRARCKRNAA